MRPQASRRHEDICSPRHCDTAFQNRAGAAQHNYHLILLLQRGELSLLCGTVRQFPHFEKCRIASSLCYASFSTLLSIGILRRRFPVAAKIALAMAGTTPDVPVSPIPPGGSALLTRWTSIAGASFMRIIW